MFVPFLCRLIRTIQVIISQSLFILSEMLSLELILIKFFPMFFLDGDTLIFIDYRSDRMRQIVECFGIQKHFDFDPTVEPKNIVR